MVTWLLTTINAPLQGDFDIRGGFNILILYSTTSNDDRNLYDY